MQEVRWSEQVIQAGSSRILISGANNIFSSALVVLFRNIISAEIVTMPEIQVQVFVGMTLPEVFFWRMKEGDIPDRGIPRIVFCSDSCFRMLSGTSGYERALFITPDVRIYSLAEKIGEWVGDYSSHSSRCIIALLKGRDSRTMQLLKKDISLHFEARRTFRSVKTLYCQRSLLSSRIGTRSRQELYLKTRLILSQKQNVTLSESNTAS
ncbi:hypothetical protein [Serratia fonticola]